MKVGSATVDREALPSVSVESKERQEIRTSRTTEHGEERDERSACAYEDKATYHQ